MREVDTVLHGIAPDRPILIAGPTASGKSGLALQIAEQYGGIIVNADALQVFGGWRILTARPSAADQARVPHRLYGHVARDADYSVGAWLAAVAKVLAEPARPIIVGGTGLYFRALTEGLAAIPPTPPSVRETADMMPLPALLAELDPRTAVRIDVQNRARVQRAWEVLTATGRGLADWQDDTGAALLPLNQATPLLLMPEVAALNDRIARRFDMMLAEGLIAEAHGIATTWNPDRLSSSAIGAAEMIAHVKGALPLAAAQDAVITATRQYAKRQRTWFRARMGGWTHLPR